DRVEERLHRPFGRHRRRKRPVRARHPLEVGQGSQNERSEAEAGGAPDQLPPREFGGDIVSHRSTEQSALILHAAADGSRGSRGPGSDPELWHWRGRYFFDKALGIGGVAVHRFRVGGVPMDPSPYAPDFLKPYMYPRGGGGAIFQLEGPADPQCAKKVDTST